VDCDRRLVFEDLAREDCLQLLEREQVGRVALTARALPIVLPVNFALLDGDIVWRSAQGTKLNDASAGFVVAFESTTMSWTGDKVGTSWCRGSHTWSPMTRSWIGRWS